MNFTFFVPGIPVTQGSTRAFVRGNRAIVTHDKREPLLNWRNAIAFAALAARPEDFPKAAPVVVAADFYLPRPASTPKKVIFPVKKPDIDKLGRAVLDALTGVVLNDDSQVIRLVLEKHYTANEQASGVHVVIRECGIA